MDHESRRQQRFFGKLLGITIGLAIIAVAFAISQYWSMRYLLKEPSRLCHFRGMPPGTSRGNYAKSALAHHRNPPMNSSDPLSRIG